MAKKRIVKDYEALPEDVVTQVKIAYPTGFEDHLVSYNNAKGDKVSALPFETEEIYYLIRMTVKEARQIIASDDDYDDDGILRDDFEDDIEESFDGNGVEADEVAGAVEDEDDPIIVRKNKSLDPDEYSDEDI